MESFHDAIAIPQVETDDVFRQNLQKIPAFKPVGDSPSDIANYAITMAVGQVDSFTHLLLLSVIRVLVLLDCDSFAVQSYRGLLYQWEHRNIGLSVETNCAGMHV